MAILNVSVVAAQTTASTTAGTSFATSSWTPTAGALYIVGVQSSFGSPPINTPTMSGNGMTWTQIGSTSPHATIVAPNRRITLFRAIGVASAGATTIDFAGQSQTGHARIFLLVDGVVTSGTNGADAIVQSNQNASDTNGTSLTVSLSDLAKPQNASLIVGGQAVQGTFTSSQSLLQTHNYSAPTTDQGAAWQLGGKAASLTSDTAGQWGAVAVELNALDVPRLATPRTRP